jgi:hypothetical protein
LSLKYDSERRAIGFDDGVYRLSTGKAGMDDRIHHRRENFSGQRRDR